MIDQLIITVHVVDSGLLFVSCVELMLSKRIQSEEPIFRGRKNLKWIVTLSNDEKLFVKQYNQQRYKGKLFCVKKALVIQNKLQQYGIVCPKIHTWN